MPHGGCWKAENLHTWALLTFHCILSGLIHISCAVVSSASGQPEHGPGNKQNKTWQVGWQTPGFGKPSSISKKLSPTQTPWVSYPPCEFLSQSWLWKPECPQVQKEKPPWASPTCSMLQVTGGRTFHTEAVPHPEACSGGAEASGRGLVSAEFLKQA